MEDDLEKPRTKMNANELLAFQRDLKQEKELLLKILTKIDDQVHRLQVNINLVKSVLPLETHFITKSLRWSSSIC